MSFGGYSRQYKIQQQVPTCSDSIEMTGYSNIPDTRPRRRVEYPAHALHKELCSDKPLIVKIMWGDVRKLTESDHDKILVFPLALYHYSTTNHDSYVISGQTLEKKFPPRQNMMVFRLKGDFGEHLKRVGDYVKYLNISSTLVIELNFRTKCIVQSQVQNGMTLTSVILFSTGKSKDRDLRLLLPDKVAPLLDPVGSRLPFRKMALEGDTYLLQDGDYKQGYYYLFNDLLILARYQRNIPNRFIKKYDIMHVNIAKPTQNGTMLLTSQEQCLAIAAPGVWDILKFTSNHKKKEFEENFTKMQQKRQKLQSSKLCEVDINNEATTEQKSIWLTVEDLKRDLKITATNELADGTPVTISCYDNKKNKILLSDPTNLLSVVLCNSGFHFGKDILLSSTLQFKISLEITTAAGTLEEMKKSKSKSRGDQHYIRQGENLMWRSSSDTITYKRIGNNLEYFIRDKAVVPILRYMCAAMYNNRHSSKAVGLFRESANRKNLTELLQLVDNDEPYSSVEHYPLRDVAVALKQILASIPMGIFNCCTDKDSIILPNNLSDVAKLDRVKSLINGLPNANQQFLEMYLIMLHLFSLYSHVHKMTTTNLAICHSPSFGLADEKDIMVKNQHPHETLVFILDNVENIYHIDVIKRWIQEFESFSGLSFKKDLTDHSTMRKTNVSLSINDLSLKHNHHLASSCDSESITSQAPSPQLSRSTFCQPCPPPRFKRKNTDFRTSRIEKSSATEAEKHSMSFLTSESSTDNPALSFCEVLSRPSSSNSYSLNVSLQKQSSTDNITDNSSACNVQVNDF